MNKRFFVIPLVIFLTICCVYAGDVAAFDDIGFSADGKTYIFGQYGITDKDYQGYAELCAVDIETNEFRKDGFFKTSASKETSGKSGAVVYEALKSSHSYWLDSWKATPASIGDILYIRPYNSRQGATEISVKDFEHSTIDNVCSYSFKLVPYKEGKGKNVVSSFFIAVEKKDANGKVLANFTAGTPSVKRKGISGYSIEKIMCTPDAKNFVILIEKTSEEDAAPSLRYMVETFSIK